MSLGTGNQAHCDRTEIQVARRYLDMLAEAGVKVTTSRYDGMIHGFFGMGAIVSRANDAVDEASKALRAAFGQ